jgi:hypothetical protein
MTLNEWFQVTGVEPVTFSSGRDTASVVVSGNEPSLDRLTDFVVFARRGEVVWLESRENVRLREGNRENSGWRAVASVREAHGCYREQAEAEADEFLREFRDVQKRVVAKLEAENS